MTAQDMNAIVVTGASGFLGKQLVLELCTSRPDAEVWAFVRAPSQPGFREWLTKHRVRTDRLVVVDADVTVEGCGLDDDQVALLRGREVDVYHCAAHYELDDDDPELNWSINVEGTDQVLRLAESFGAASLHHASTVAVAGEYRGMWTEDHFLEAQAWRSSYGRTKHRAEQLVRESAIPTRTISRFGVLVGDEATGCYFKSDGIYSFFEMVRRLVDAVPGGVPLPSLGWGSVPLAPVDHAAATMVALAGSAAPGCSVFHVFEDRVRRADDLLRLVLQAAGHEQTANVGWVGHVAQWFNERARHDGVLTKLKGDVLDIVAEASVPTALLPELAHPTQFTNRATAGRQRALGIQSTEFERYVPLLWHGWLARTAMASKQQTESFFQGKRVLLSGATSGIGRAILFKILDRGATVIVLGRDREKLDAALSGVSAGAAERVTFVACDLLDDASIAEALDEIEDLGLAVDIFIHSAGVSIHRAFLRMPSDLEGVTRMTQVNFLAPLRIMRAILPDMAGRPDSRIVALSSISTQLEVPGFGPYSATKSALDQVLRVLRTELLGEGVAFTTVHLPLVKSPMTDKNIGLRNVPMLSESAASELVLTATADGKPSAGPRLGRFFEGVRLLYPTFAPLVTNLGWKVYLRLPYFSRVTGAALDTARG